MSKKIHINKKEKMKSDIPNKFDSINANSNTECTGLIQTPCLTEFESDSYEDIYQYFPKQTVEKAEENESKNSNNKQ